MAYCTLDTSVCRGERPRAMVEAILLTSRLQHPCHGQASKCKQETHGNYGPCLPPRTAACSHAAAAMFAPVRCSSLPMCCRTPNMAKDIGPN